MKKILSFILKYWVFIILALQPVLDIVAYFSFNSYITPISFIMRTLILVFIVLFTFIKSKNKKKFILCMLPIIIFSLIHLFNSYRVGMLNIFDDLRYLIIVMQMPVLSICFIDYIKENQEYIDQFKFGMIINILIIFASLVLAMLTGVFNFTYEGYGLTGWFTSANTQSMILVSLCPLFLYYMSKSTKTYIYIISHLIILFLLFFNGTKACFLALVVSLIAMLYIAFVTTKSRERIVKCLITFSCILFVIIFSKSSYTFQRLESVNDNKEETENILLEKVENLTREEILEILNNNYYWKELIDLYGEDRIIEKMESYIDSSSLVDNRLRKRIYASIIYEDSDLPTKFVGFEFTKIGNLKMDLENDFTAIFYYYGYIGFALYLMFICIFIYLLFKMFIKNKKIIFDGEFIIYCISLGLIIFGSEYTGAFLRKSNANIYLSCLFLLIYFKYVKETKKVVLKKNKITFLLLHLGYGGIETSSINTANELSKKYDVEIVSFYKLNKNQEKNLTDRVKVKYLYNGGPNKEILFECINKKKIFGILKNGLLAVKILILKNYLIIKEIINNDSFAIVSTRNEFSILLNKFGSKEVIKIAQEHQHHNNIKKYTDNIKYNFYNIDYLFALTHSLKEDYEQFLLNNKKTKVLVVPNMVYLPSVKSELKNNNIITICRLHPGKRIDELIQIFSKLSDKTSKLYIVGDGEEFEKLKILVKENKLSKRVIFTGYQNKEQMEKYLLDSSVFAMTSISEGLPMVLLEAMGYGIPCIAYKTESGVSDIIDDDLNGYIVENRNQKEYVNKLDYILRDKKSLKKFSKNSIKKANEFVPKRIIKIWESVLEDEK